MPTIVELEQKELRERWGNISLRTVKRIVAEFGPKEPVRYKGLCPVFSTQQANAMFSLWQTDKKKSRRKVSRNMRRIWRARKVNGNGNGHAVKIHSLPEIKRRANR